MKTYESAYHYGLFLTGFGFRLYNEMDGHMGLQKLTTMRDGSTTGLVYLTEFLHLL